MRPFLRTLPGLVLFSVCIGGPGAAAAQIVTDRPDFVESSSTVGPRVLQVETSVAMTRADGAEEWSTPTLIRLGLGAVWELRLEGPGYVHVRGPVAESGLGDVSAGVKLHALAPESPALPSVGILLHADLPTGSRGVSQSGVRPSLRVVGEWTLDPRLALGIMAGIRSERAGSARFSSGILGLVLGQTWSGTLRTYTELALPQMAGDANGGVVGLVNVGAALLLGEDGQVDVGFGLPITSQAPEVMIGLGFSHRFRF
ncbi:MAG TPA: transporter [Longimicrobiales bacterium]|nr:transporter [Longimicrobiales bacterium]